MAKEGSAEATIRDIQRKTRRKYNTEEKIRIVIEGLRGEQSIAESLYYSWSKEFMEAGKARLAGNTKRQASSSEGDDRRQENEQLKQQSQAFKATEVGHRRLSVLDMAQKRAVYLSLRVCQALGLRSRIVLQLPGVYPFSFFPHIPVVGHKLYFTSAGITYADSAPQSASIRGD